MKQKLRLGLITSKGGHLFQLIQLKDFWKTQDRFWVTFDGPDIKYYLRNEKKYFAFYPESRNIFNAIRNFLLSFRILKKERPKILISTGAAIAVSFFIVGKIFFKTKLIYIEPYDFVSYPSLTGKILYNFVDLFLIQHRHQKKWYPKAKYWGSLL